VFIELNIKTERAQGTGRGIQQADVARMFPVVLGEVAIDQPLLGIRS